jgi:nucleoside-diphosphate-sugar epimerase
MKTLSYPQIAGKRILITGVSGFLGFSLAEKLLQAGAVVCGISRTKNRIRKIQDSRDFTHMVCNLESHEEVRNRILQYRPEILFHLAAHPDGREEIAHLHATVGSNIVGTINALDAFSSCGGELFVYGDSCKVYGNSDEPNREALPAQPISSYAIAKVAGWEYCKLYARLHGFAVVSVRPTLIYGPNQGNNLISYVARAVLDGKADLTLDGGTQTRAPLYIQDAIQAFMAIALKGRAVNGRIINIGGGDEISVYELARLIVRLMGSNMHVMVDMQRMRETESMRSYCDNQEAFENIGWKAQVSLQEGLKRTIKYLSTAGQSNIGIFAKFNHQITHLHPRTQTA